MDGLSQEERALAWAASWDPSFAGVAIVDGDFSFRSVNPQFCDIVGVSPGELIGMKFQDITPQPIKNIDMKNARLVQEGKIDSYLLPKSYEFENGRKVKVVLLVKGVYSDMGEFQFFVSRIMLDGLIPDTVSSTPHQKPTAILDFIKSYASIFVAIGTVIGATIWTIIKYLSGTLK
jgi:PAS domain S-box-containing protein